MDTLKLAELFDSSVSESTERELLEDLDISFTIKEKSLAFKKKILYSGYNYLHIAVIEENLDLLKKLLALGVNLLQQGVCDGKTPLHIAADLDKKYFGEPKWKFVDTLLSAQVKSNNLFNVECKSGMSHLHIACMSNHVKAVKFFIRSRNSINERISLDSDELPGYTPLHCAIKHSSLEVASLLLENGVDIYIENGQGLNSVCYLIERLLQACNLKMTYGESGFRYYSDVKAVEKLNPILESIIKKYKNNDAELVEHTGISTFHLVCMLKCKSFKESHICCNFRKTINKQVSDKSKLYSGWTPLHFAACCNIQKFELLLQHETDIRVKNVKGETALDFCLQQHSPEEILSFVSIEILLTDKSTKLSDVMLSISKNNASQEFLKNLKDVNLSVSRESPFWPGYNLLHMFLSMNRKVPLNVSHTKKNKYYLNADYSVSYCYDVTPPSYAIFWEKLEILLEMGCSVSAKNGNGLTPIHKAFEFDDWHVTEVLLVHAGRDVVGPDNLSLFHIAIAMGKTDVVDLLLKNGANVNTPITSCLVRYKKPQWYSEMSYQNKLRRVIIRKDSTPLHIAVLFNTNLVSKLLKRSADVHAKDELGFTPLHLSLASSRRMAKDLLDGLSNLREVKREDGLSHLHVAAFANDEKALKKLVQSGSDVNGFIKNTVTNNFASVVGRTPLHLAVWDEKSARALILKGANIFAENPYWNNDTPLDLAMKALKSGGSKVLFRKLKSSKIKIDALTSSGLTTLHVACATLDLDWANKLLKKGSNPNSPMNDGQGRANTPMHLVIKSFNSGLGPSENVVPIIELLLEYGADVRANDNYETPLHMIANSYFNPEWNPLYNEGIPKATVLSIADLMLSNQKSYTLNPTNADGFSHFHLACVTNNLVVIRNYLENGIDVNHSMYSSTWQKGNFTPLHFAVENKNGDVARLLVKHGANVKAEDVYGDTPLHLAVNSNFVDFHLFDALLKKGADINAKNRKDQTPFMCLLGNNIWGNNTRNITYDLFCFFISRKITITETIYDGQGFLGYTLDHTELSHVELVFQAFIEFVNINNAMKKGYLPIHNLVSVYHAKQLTCQHYLKFIQKLIDEGSYIDDRNKKGKVALDLAMNFRNNRAIEALLLLGADVNLVEKKKEFSSLVGVLRSKHGEDFIMLLKKHVWKMVLLKLDLIVPILKVMNDRKWELDDTDVQVCQLELDKIKHTKIFPSLTAGNFLSEWGAVINYPTMSVGERQAVDDFFKRGDELRKEFPEFAGLLAIQYRKALARRKLMQPAKDILVEAGIDLPDLCLEAILKYFKNSELNFWIDKVSEEPHSSKRRRIAVEED